ncbi:beta-galactosidase [Paenibacillus qinlingensis]|uniref:beta-galactosidase n=1 Tax=Paenibacillus qinlingensis TaxID=1837343 RepID=UPI001566D88A|nr:beta-galactosidase [Paenibacillus qinlingensis]NQX58808.1 beta-galactosidase [Paenibacillus qinlingensis]
MYFGACYYPEHWPEERWETDARLMKEAHFNVVRMAEFAWSRLEPTDGEFDFSWLDRSMGIMEHYGIKTILGTPTAGPPKWLMDKHPGIYQQDMYERMRGFGARRHYCFNNLDFRMYTERIVTQMAHHYGTNTNVIGWQIDNEFGMIDTARCYCSSCRQSFIGWLQRKYGSIEAVNEAWGTVFSSQTYRTWDELHLPAYAVHQHHNPGLALDYRRFSSDSVNEYQRLQVNILRHYTTGQPITHNAMGKYNQVDFYDLSKELDLISLDVYPNMKSEPKERPAYAAEQHDMTRGFKDGRNYWVLEHQSGAPGAVEMAPTPIPGELRRWTFQSVARGADAIVYFRWRTLPYSIEELWHGILQHHGEPGRKYEEVKQVGLELKKLAPLLAETSPCAKVALIRCYNNEWAFELQPHMKGYEYIKHFEKYYAYFYDRGIPVDIVSPEEDFTGYDLLVAPNLMMAKAETVQALYRFVEEGGYFITDIRTGAKEWNNQITQMRLPGLFRDLLGIGIEDYGIIEGEQEIGMRNLNDGKISAATMWYEVIDLLAVESAAEPMAMYTGGYYRETPAVTRRAYGKGCGVYIGTVPDKEGLYGILDQIVSETGITPILYGLPEGVEAMVRVGDDDSGRKLLFIINHTEGVVTVNLDTTYTDAFTDRSVSGAIVLASQDARILYV